MLIQTEYKLIKLSDAKCILDSGGKVYILSQDGLAHYEVLRQTQLVAGNVFKQVQVEYPNQFGADELLVTKLSDGNYLFEVGEYGVDEANLNYNQSIELAQFLAEPFKEIK